MENQQPQPLPSSMNPDSTPQTTLETPTSTQVPLSPNTVITPPPKPANKLFLLLGTFILVLGLIGAGGIVYMKQPFTPVVTQENTLESASSENEVAETSTAGDDAQAYAQRLFDPTAKFFGAHDFPLELTNLSDDQLQAIKCSPRYDKNDQGQFVATNIDDHSEIELTDPRLKAILTGNTSITAISLCETEAGETLVHYEIGAGGGGMQTVAYFGLLDADSNLDQTIDIPADDAPYFNCTQPLALTTNNIFYYGCGGGDGGFSQATIYKIDISTHQAAQLAKCTSTADGTGNSTSECEQTRLVE